MATIVYDPLIREQVDAILLSHPLVVPGKMFGHPAYFVNRKLFACVYEDGVGLKVPADLASELVGREGITPFVPMGRRRMKEWIHIARKTPAEYVQDADTFRQSIEYVASIVK